MEKFIYYNNLFLIYKDLLTTKNSEIFNLYYGENLSMQEIADIKGISKSRVGIIIKNVQNKLDKYEHILKINATNNLLRCLQKESDIAIIKKELDNILRG